MKYDQSISPCPHETGPQCQSKIHRVKANGLKQKGGWYLLLQLPMKEWKLIKWPLSASIWHFDWIYLNLHALSSGANSLDYNIKTRRIDTANSASAWCYKNLAQYAALEIGCVSRLSTSLKLTRTDMNLSATYDFPLVIHSIHESIS